MTVSVDYTFNHTMHDNAAANPLVLSSPAITGNGLDETGSLNSTTTPAVSKVAAGAAAMTAGLATIDLTALTGLDGTSRTLNALKVVLAKFKNPGANPITIAKGAANGYTGFGSAFSHTIPPGGTASFNLSTGGVAVDGTHKTLDVSGTGTDTLQYSFSAG